MNFSSLQNGEKERGGIKAFGLGLLLSLLVFLPFILFDDGYFLFYGDFNVQQIPFYQMCHDAIRDGNWRWSWTTDLGANFIGSYSFYLLGSPFFWLTIPFPGEMVPHLMGPLLILKFSCASLTGYVYLKRYMRSPNYAVIGGLLYAFSGFSVYNIFFNHFHEAIVFFPLLLAALDEFMYHHRRGIFVLAVALCCFVNYYFFVGQVVFCIIYWFVRVLCRSWRFHLRDFAILLFEAFLGLFLTSGLLLPTILAVLQNPRVDNPPNGWNALIYGWSQRYFHILQCFFFPPDLPARPNFTPDSGSKWSSLGAWLPLFSMTGVIAFLQSRRHHWLKKLLGILFLMAMVPVLNSAFQLFNSSYYARWFYMLTLMMSLATILAMQNSGIDWARALRWTVGITVGMAVAIGLMPSTETVEGVEVTTIGLEDYPTRFWTYVAISLMSLLLLAVILRYYKKNTKKFLRYTTVGVSVIAVIYAAFFIALGKTQTEDVRKQLLPYAMNGRQNLDLPDLENCRSDFYKAMDNQAMYWQIPSIQAFHSIVPGSIMEFYPSIGVTRDVGSRPDTSTYGLRGLTSCRWLFDFTGDSEHFGGDTDPHSDPKMPGWVYYDTQNSYDIWENKYYIPMGFSYDYYVTEEQYEETAEGDRNLLLLKALVLSDEQVEEYKSMLYPLNTENVLYTKEEYYQDCRNRKSMSCTEFSHDNTGFSATFESDKPRLVFFSVPYESGWSAQVNGQDVAIEKVNVGFMAIRVPEGVSEIRFTYRTPGLLLGVGISALALLVYLVYLWIIRRRDRFWNHEYGRHFYRVLQPLPGARKYQMYLWERICKNYCLPMPDKFPCDNVEPPSSGIEEESVDPVPDSSSGDSLQPEASREKEPLETPDPGREKADTDPLAALTAGQEKPHTEDAETSSRTEKDRNGEEIPGSSAEEADPNEGCMVPEKSKEEEE